MPTRKRNFLSEMKNRIENRLNGATRRKGRPRTHGLSPLNPKRQTEHTQSRKQKESTESRKRKSKINNSNSESSKRRAYAEAHKEAYDPMDTGNNM